MTLAIILISVLVPFAFLAAIVSMAQGRLTALRNGARNAYRRVDEQLARRYLRVREQLAGHQGGAEADAATRAVDRAEEARSAVEKALEDQPAAEALLRAEEELGSALAALSLPADEDSGDRLAFVCEIYNDTVFRYSEFRNRTAARLTARLFGFSEIRKITLSSASSPAPEGGE